MCSEACVSVTVSVFRRGEFGVSGSPYCSIQRPATMSVQGPHTHTYLTYSPSSFFFLPPLGLPFAWKCEILCHSLKPDIVPDFTLILEGGKGKRVCLMSLPPLALYHSPPRLPFLTLDLQEDSHGALLPCLNF